MFQRVRSYISDDDCLGEGGLSAILLPENYSSYIPKETTGTGEGFLIMQFASWKTIVHLLGRNQISCIRQGSCIYAYLVHSR